MQSMTAVPRQFLLMTAFALLLAGCNLFTGLHEDGKESNASVLVADGQAALARGDNANAMHYFDQAIQNDPRSSEARVGYTEAFLKNKGYLFSSLMKTVMNSKSSGPTDFIKPQDWGCQTYAELSTMANTLISVLDPIANGQTFGEYLSTNVSVNFTVGFFYIIRATAQAQQISTTYTVVELQKSSTSAAALGITQAEFDLLPDKFYWLDNHPPVSLLNQLQNDMNQGVARLQVAATHSAYPDQLNDMVKQFQSLQIQTQ